jgi:PAS domain S-box-containing protein
MLGHERITLFVTDRRGVFTVSEGRGLEGTGLKPGDNVGRSAYELYGTLPVKLASGETITGAQVLDRVLAGESLSGFTSAFGMSFHNWFSPLRGPDGSIEGMTGVAVDVTVFRQAEEALRETTLRAEERERQRQRMIDALFDHNVSCLVLLDRHFNFLRVNQAYADACGRPISDFAGRNHFELYPSEAEEIFREVVRSRRPYRASAHPFVFPEDPQRGVTYWDWTLVPVLDQAGEVEFLIFSLNDVTQRTVAAQRLNQSEAELRELARRLQTVREEEQVRIARELHDELGQSLTALRLDALWLRGLLAANAAPESWKRHLDRMLETLDGSLVAMRRVAAELRPPLLEHLGLAAAAEWLVQRFARQTRIQCDLTVNLEDANVDADRALALYRILQETLTNVAQHAEATRVTVSLGVCRGSAVLEVGDNGRGMRDHEPTRTTSLGLLGMQERARVWGGEVNYRAVPGRGTVVTATIPLGPPPGADPP